MTRFALAGFVLLVTPAGHGFQARSGADTTGVVQGRIIEAKTDPAVPVRKALVILRRGQEPGIGVYSDEKGNYRLQTEPGANTLTVERDGFVTDPQADLKTITVQAGQTIQGVTVPMVRTGTVSGRIVDADGEPVARAFARLVSIRDRKGAVATGANTDDRGDYRIFQVPPGRYRLSVDYQPQFQLREIKLQSPNGATEEAFATTFFPGTANSDQAAVIEVGAGADLSGIDLRLQRLRAFRIRGRVVGMESAPLQMAMIGLQSAGTQPGPVRSAVVRGPTGEFELTAVPAGRYVLTANAPGLNNGVGPSAEEIIEVGQSDVEGVQLTLARPQKVVGAIVAPEGRQIPAGLLVVLSPRERRNAHRGELAQIAPDGTFSVAAVAPGEYEVTLGSTGPGDDLYVGSMRSGDEDVLANGLHVSASGADPFQIVLRGNGGTVEIKVRTRKGEPAPEAHVALLPDPPRRRQMALFGDCTTDAGGACTLRGVAPGDYHVFALPREPGIDFRDPESTKDFEMLAKPVTVTEGGRQSAELELTAEDQ